MKKEIEQYEKACNDLIELFCKKQNLEFDYWVSDEVGGIAYFTADYFFNLSDIVLDLKTKQKAGLITQWQDETTEANMNEEGVFINYKLYTMGLRYENLNDNNEK